ncbi:DUF2750 domain-containing protein [Umboniibacter marinipuniceus]|uniref:Uncharacterized protein DUF2750 n=1 Tax=Umboniibacter marinipuniceus TaxID=569599 RepID=A0A3M0A889_9GAMM|nr:DUF2750 domain-containing protein [Umboniibacter marinipuniceus]RMA81030.1 uncharacterized protein DUF2750 [Umboniibacter marinipuniceus]
MLTDNSHDNFEIFLQQIVSTGSVWTLKNDDGFAVVGSERFPDGEVIPFWSEKAFVEAVLTDDWASFEVVEIALEGFVEEWLEGMHEDEFLVGVNWTEALEGVEIEPMDLADQIDSLLDDIE